MKFTLKSVAAQAPELALSVISEMKSGKSNGLEWADEIVAGKTTIKEMIGTDDGSREFVEKITYDLYSGRETVPLIYKPIYSQVSDPNLPQTFTAKEFGPVQVVFLQKYEGGEVRFGDIGPETEKVVQIVTYAAGIEYSEDMIEFNQTWRLSEVGEAFGEAYNKLLNHIHLYPIVNGTFETTGDSLADQKVAQEGGTAQLVEFDTDLSTTLRNALTVLPRGSKLLINSSDRYRVEDAIAASMYADTSPSVVKRKLSSDDIIEYDGDEVVVGGKTYTYEGVTAGEAYLLVPKKYFKEYVKHDLRVDSGDGDLSRLIVTQLVGRCRRGVMVSLGNKQGAIKLELEA